VSDPECHSFSSSSLLFPSYLLSFPTRRSSDLFLRAVGNHVDYLRAKLKFTRLIRREETCAGVVGFPAQRPIEFGGVACALVNGRSEEHTSELQSRGHLVCRLLLEKKKKT